MRTLMVISTLAAAGAGYVYLQQSTPSSESAGKVSASRALTETGLSRSDGSRSSVKDLVGQIHEHTRSIIDDFANQHGGHSDAPTDNAFQRLKQVTQSSGLSSTVATQPDSSVAATGNSDRSLTSKLDDLQRSAFDPVSDTTASKDDSELKGKDTLADNSEATSRRSDVPVRVVAESNAPDGKAAGKELDPVASRSGESRSGTRIASGTPAQQLIAEWKIVGKTTEGRSMHAMHLGKGGTKTFVIAGLDGQDRAAVRWLEQLADGMAKRPDLLENHEVLLFRAGNPDGLVRKQKENARGVSLNKNFPSRNARSSFGLSTTPSGASEAETRVMMETLNSFRPERVIHLVSGTARSQIVNNRRGNSLAADLERSLSIRAYPFDPAKAPGSIEDFADNSLQASVVLLGLNVGADWRQTWAAAQPKVFAAIVGRPLDLSDVKRIEEQDPDKTQLPLPLPNVDPISRKGARRGYEELPAPPET